MSWLLPIIFAVALAATMVGWAAVVASSLNHTMHALNGNGPGKGRPSKIGKAECLVAAQKYKCEWLGVVSDGDVVNDADKIRSNGVAMRWQCGGCGQAFDREYRHFCERGLEAHLCGSQNKDFTCSSCGRSYKDQRSLARHQRESQCGEPAAIGVTVARCTENKRRAGAAGRKEDKRRAGEIGGKGGSKEDKRRAGDARSKEDKQRAGHIGGKGGSKEDKRRARETGSKEDKRRAGETASKEDKRRAGEAGSKEDKQRAGHIGGKGGSKEDKWRAREAGSKEDKQRAAETGRWSRALNYARQKIVGTASTAVKYLRMNHKEREGGAYHLDDEEDALLCSKQNPCADEFKGNLVGTSLSSTVRSFWEQGGHDRFTPFEEDDLVDAELVAKLVKEIENENVSPEEMVSLAREWFAKVGRCEDVKSCGCCGIRDFHQVKEVCLEDLKLLELSAHDATRYRNTAAQFRKYFCVHEHGGQLFWLIPELVDEEVVPICVSCHRQLFSKKKRPCMPPHSIAAGKHFGRLGDLPALMDMEEHMLSRVRTTVNTVKLVSTTSGAASQWGIRGHTISIPPEGPEVLASRLPDVKALTGTKVIFVGKQTELDAVRRNPKTRHQVERVFQPRWDALVQWLCVLKAVNPLYANIVIDEIEPVEVSEYMNSLFDSISVGEHPDVVASERMSGADIANPERTEEATVLDAVMLLDGSLVGRDGDDCTKVLQSIKELLADKRNTVVGREARAVNEFTANDRLLHLSFPTLFIFGVGITRCYGLVVDDTHHLLLQHDNRIAENRDFCLVLFNQKFRHTALRTVSDSVYSNPEKLKAFEKAMNSRTLDTDLAEAHANPRGATAQRLVGQFLPLLRSCHAAVPFSTSERYAVMGKMNSLLLFFGMATLFYTVAPNDIDNQLVLHLSIGGSSAQVPLPGVSQRFASLAKNPVAAARIFERQVRAFLEVVLGLPSASVTRKDRPVCTRKNGLFGTCVAHCTCYECQGRGSLHFHGLFWGGIPPWLLDMVRGNGDLIRAVAAALDQQICASLDAELHDAWEHRTREGVKAPRMLEKQQLLGELPDDPGAAAKIIEQFSDEVFGHLYIHRCLISSCGKPPGGKCGCRFALPRAAGEYYSETRPYFVVARKGTGNCYTIEVYKSEEEFDRPEESVACVLVVWELKRPDPRDGRVVEGNKLMAYLFASNTNVQHLGGEDVLIAVAKYVVGYCSKNPVQVANVMSTIRQVSREVKEMERGASSMKDETTFLLKRIINSLDKKVEFSAQMAAISLLGYPSWQCSHKFIVFHPWGLIGALPTMFSHVEGLVPDDAATCSDDEYEEDGTDSNESNVVANNEANTNELHDDSLAEELLDNEEADGESEAGLVASDDAEFEALEASFVSGELNELTMSAMQQDLEAPCHSQLYTIGSGDTIQKIAVSPALHYACRGTRLRRLCALEYACLIKVEHQRARATPSQVDDDGRPENASFDFHPRHILCEDDYVQYLVSQSRCPIFAGKKLPVYPGDDGSVKLKKNWATFVMCAFVPWDIECPPKLTWSAYVEWATHCQSEHASYSCAADLPW